MKDKFLFGRKAGSGTVFRKLLNNNKIPKDAEPEVLSIILPRGYEDDLGVGVISVESWIRVLKPLRTHRIKGLMHVKSDEPQSS
ncbi:hypothetical protein TNCV_4704691 [Trichonephila clavipes]|nr:hypothetical protein TNCV_4704691 [Trichonephila clavipes]